MIYRVKDALEAVAPFVEGAGLQLCNQANREKALAFYNRIVSRLMREGAYTAGVVREVCLPVSDCCLTVDSSILNVRNIRAFNGPGPTVEIRSMGFKYLESGPGQIENCCGDCLTVMEDLGDGFVLHQEIEKPAHLLAFSDRPEDKNAQIVFRGRDGRGREIGQHLPIVMGSPENHPRFTAGDQYSPGTYADLHYIGKPKTLGYMSVFSWIPETQELQWLTTLRPDELAPCHRRYKLDGVPKSGIVKASVTLRFVPACSEDQIALIQNMEALEGMAIALSAHDSATPDGFQNYSAYKASSVSQLKKGVRESLGNHKVGINVKVPMAPGRIPSGSMRGRGRSFF